MTIKIQVEECIKAFCPDCKRETSTQVVYGYPLREDLPPNSVYGGDECPAGSPTHYCDRCDVAWCVADCPSLFFGFPGDCYFCAASLDAKDQLTYSMEFEDWMASEDSSLRLTDDTFAQSLYPVCSKCRNEIRVNLDELAAQEGQEDRQRMVAVRVAIGVLLFFILLIVNAVLRAR